VQSPDIRSYIAILRPNATNVQQSSRPAEFGGRVKAVCAEEK
jgi:hypothetical protein